ncbi:hemolysin-III channel Izh2 protein [Rutstroemia sp. NJR-2017a BVV2]|nr:hemolysin-III channel Izh2 protein [Rutstroemia sp. NJR-2017a BVV2]
MDFITAEKGAQPTLSETEPPHHPPPPSSSSLLTYDELPSWHQDNPLIRTSYRRISYSVLSSLRSSLHIHNETLNIHTHSVPFLLCLFFTGFIFYLLPHHYPSASRADKAVFSLWFALSAACLGLSAGYHTLMNHSQKVASRWLRLDFVGIVLMILGDFASGIYVAFYCEGRLRVGYWCMILALAGLSVVVLLHPRFQGPRWRIFRVGLFVGTACSGFAPIVNAIVVFGWREVVRGTGMPWYLGEGGLLVVAATVYAMRIPERYRPGKYDLVGHSHQIFHALVVVATGLHLVGLLTAYNYEYHHPRCGSR